MIKDLSDLIVDGSVIAAGWACKAIVWEDNFCYLTWNLHSREAVLVDTCREDMKDLNSLLGSLPELRILAVIDTHTHADHVSAGASWSEKLRAPWVMHVESRTRRSQIRVFSDTFWPAQAGPLRFVTTPGHTPDGLTALWGPFLFAGDTLLYGDTGRDDLPGGDPSAHYDSLQKLKGIVSPDALVLPGHDAEGGRISSWKTQLAMNESLRQDRSDFIREAVAYVAAAPKNVEASLLENLR